MIIAFSESETRRVGLEVRTMHLIKLIQVSKEIHTYTLYT